MNVLITNSGRKNYFIEFLLDIKKNNLKSLKIHISNSNKNCSTFHMKKKLNCHILSPYIEGKNKYLRKLSNTVKKNKIDIIIPLTDLDLKLLSEKEKYFKNLGCLPLISKLETIQICLDKEKTYKFLLKNKISTPRLFSKNSNIKYPVIVKDKLGNSSQGLKIIKNKSLLKLFKSKKNIIQKYISGPEYHLDILNDLNGNYIDHCGKLKIEMRDGETFKAKIINNKKLNFIAKKISKSLRHVGNLDCDLIFNKNKFYVIDFNPRFGGGYPFTHLSGKNYILKIMSIINKKKYNLKKKPNLITGMKSLGLNYYL